MQKFRFLIKKKKLFRNSINHSFSIYPIQICSCNKNTNQSEIDFENFQIFWNCCFDKGRLKSFVSWFLNTYGENKTIALLEELKNLGFGYATKAGISLGIDDLKIPPQKFDLINKAQSKIFKGLEKYKKGQITGIERIQQLIDVWNQTSEFLKQEVIRYFETTDLFNPVYMMAFSGARGNISQVRQLVGMRGLMSDPQGNIIDFPIQSNFREGLTLTEYIISTYGARKGIVDTALRTATAGYLTRRLVDVAQHVMISQFDCGTTRGIFVLDMKEGTKTIYSFQNRLIGRVLAEDISLKNLESNSLVSIKKIYRNQEISASLACLISKRTKRAFVRSPLTCETGKFICQLCYGWSLASSRLVSIGEAVGVIAAQSIGEPGTQLTMRTFHTGGVFSGGLINQIIAPYDGYVQYLDPIPGTCIRTPQGDIAFLTKTKGSFFIKENKEQKLNSLNIPKPNSKKYSRYDFYIIPAYAILFARNNQKIFEKQIVAQFSSIAQQQTQRGNAEQTIYAELEGQVAFFQIDLFEQKNEKLFDDIVLKGIDWSKIWVLAGKIYYDPLGLNSFALKGDFFNKNATFQKIYWHNLNNCFFDFHLKKHKIKKLPLKVLKRLSLEKKQNIVPLIGKKTGKKNAIFFERISKNFYTKRLKKQVLFFLNNKFIYFYSINFKKKNFILRNYSKTKESRYQLSYFFLMNNKLNSFNSLHYPYSSKIKKQKNLRQKSKIFEKFSLKMKHINLNHNNGYLKNSQNFSLKKIKSSFLKKEKDSKQIKLIGLGMEQESCSLKEFQISLKNFLNIKKNHKRTSKKIWNHWNKKFVKKSIEIKSKKNLNNENILLNLFEKNGTSLGFQNPNLNKKRTFKILLKNKSNNYCSSIYPFRTNILPFLFKKINRMSFLSYYLNKKLKISLIKKNKKFKFLLLNSNKLKETNIKKITNPFLFQRLIPNFLKKKKIQNRIFSRNIEFQNSFYHFKKNFKNRELLYENGKESKFYYLEKNRKKSNFKENFISFKKINPNQFKSVNGKPSLVQKKIQKDLISKEKFSFKFVLNHKKIQKNWDFSLIKQDLNQKKTLSEENFSKQKVLLNLPVNKIYFKKLGYFLSLNRNFKKEMDSKSKIPKILKNSNFNKNEKSDIILSFFPLTTFYNTPINSSIQNDFGKNYQKLASGNTLHLSPFSNIGFRWFPFESKTMLNGIFIWSENFMRSKKRSEKEIKNWERYMENPDLSIKNSSFFQKKRGIFFDELIKKYTKKEILILNSFNKNQLVLKQKTKNQKIFSIFIKKKNKNSKTLSTVKKPIDLSQNDQKLIKKTFYLKFRYYLTLNQKLQIFVTKRDSKKLQNFNEFNIKNIEDLSEIKSSFFNLRTRFSKFSVYKTDFYYIPQENFRFHFLKKSKNAFQTNNISSKIFLSNRQGLKKLLSSQASGVFRIYTMYPKKISLKKLKNESFKTLKRNKKQGKNFLLSSFNKKIYKKGLNNKLTLNLFHLKKNLKTKQEKKFLNQTVFNKENKNLLFYKKIKKASYNMNLNIRNKMILNLLSKFFRKKTNKKPKKNENLKLSKYFKYFHFNKTFNMKKTKQKINFIAVLKNQSLFFSCIPFNFLNISKLSNSYKSNNMNLIDKFKISKTNKRNFFDNISLKSNQKKQILTESFKALKNFRTVSQKKELKPKSKFFPETSIFETIKKPGWIYFLIDDLCSSQNEEIKIKNFLSFKNLHQAFANTGKIILHDICFEQNKIYIENIHLNQKLKNQTLKMNQIYTNNNCRFFDGVNSSMIFIQNNEFSINHEKTNVFSKKIRKEHFLKNNKTEQNHLALLFRPIHHKILPNLHYYKKEISTNQKNFYNNYSILFYKDFHSNLLNLQNSNLKSFSKFPSLDFQIFAISNNRKQFQNQMFKNEIYPIKKRKKKFHGTHINSKIGNRLKYQKNLSFNIFSLNKYSESKVSKEKIQKLKKQSYNTFVSFYSVKNPNFNIFSNLFYSAYKMHSFSFELKHTKPLGFDFGFNIPTFSFKKSYFNFRKENYYNVLKGKKNVSKQKQNLNAIFYYLIRKNSLKKQWISKIPKKYPSSFSNSFYNFILENETKKKNKNFQNSFEKNFRVDFRNFFSFFFLYPSPFIEWSLSKKDANFINNLLSSAKKFQNSKQCFFPNALNWNLLNSQSIHDQMKLQSLRIAISNSKKSGILNKQSLNMQPFSFAFPRLKNSFRLYKAYNKIIANKVYGSTDLLSPFEGELLVETNMKNWWNQYSETILKHKKSNIKNAIFLTKNDLFSISIETKSFQQNGFVEKKNDLYKSSSLYLNYKNILNKSIKQKNQGNLFKKIQTSTMNSFFVRFNSSNQKKKKNYNISNFETKYQKKLYKLKGLSIGKESNTKLLYFYLGKFLLRGNNVSSSQKIDQTGQIIHLNSKKITLRYAQPFLVSPRGILHVQQGDYIYRNAPIITLPFETLTTGDIVQGIPKVEQYLEARTTQNGRFFLYSLPILQKAIFERYRSKLPFEQAVAQSFLKIQQIIVDGVQRVYRSQGVRISEKHLEVIVKQMTSKVQILHGGQTGFFPGELVDLEIVETVNKFLMIKVRYEPIVLGITRASLEVESFLSAASFQQTTKILAKASLSKKKDYLKGLKENILVGNLIPAGTGFMNSY